MQQELSIPKIIRVLAWADLKSRYQNMALGFLWSLLSPLLYASILYLVFRYIFGQAENFAANLLVGIITWRVFQIGTTTCLNSYISKSQLITKVYIPRYIPVVSSLFSTAIGAVLEFIILLSIVFILVGQIPITVMLFPLLFILYLTFTYAVGMILSLLHVFFRDLGQIWDLTCTVLFFTLPIIYPISAMSGQTLFWYLLNPLANIVIAFQNIIVGGVVPSVSSLALIVGYTIALFIISYVLYNGIERRLAEEL